MKERFLIDQLTTTNANLVDQIGRMQTHIEGYGKKLDLRMRRSMIYTMQMEMSRRSLEISIKNFMRRKLEELKAKKTWQI